jgi:hypothetical protein
MPPNPYSDNPATNATTIRFGTLETGEFVQEDYARRFEIGLNRN